MSSYRAVCSPSGRRIQGEDYLSLSHWAHDRSWLQNLLHSTSPETIGNIPDETLGKIGMVHGVRLWTWSGGRKNEDLLDRVESNGMYIRAMHAVKWTCVALSLHLTSWSFDTRMYMQSFFVTSISKYAKAYVRSQINALRCFTAFFVASLYALSALQCIQCFSGASVSR